MNIRFFFKSPKGVRRNKEYRGNTLEDAHSELHELRDWLEALTEQLEYVIGKEAETNVNKNNQRR